LGELDSLILRGGVSLDPSAGAPLGYWIRNAHPGDAYMAGMIGQFPAWTFVPRRTSSGRLRVLHAFDAERPEQHRGKPILTSVLPMFKQIDRYSGAELSAAVANAMVAGVITTPMSHEDILDMFKLPSGEFDVVGYLKMRDDHAVGLESGSILPLAPGDDFKSHLPQRPASGFSAFVENILRMIGVSADLPYELVLKDFSKTNYSSARAALLEAWRSFLRRRDNLGSQWCDPIYQCWLEEQVNAGTVDAPKFYENRAAYQRCKWIGPGRGWVDPMKEAMAAQIRVDSNMSTLEDECAEQGKDWEENLEQRATELQRMQELNIPQVVSGRATIVPEDASGDAGVVTPGGVPSNGAPATGAESYNATFAYRMAVPGSEAELMKMLRQSAETQARAAALIERMEAKFPCEDTAP
jgi:lambda family phage portal protein